ncbi:MAG: hypothetical protein I3274_02545 [Candidatus Moeniiplasma glomeromycotorum]|nr:hypothetical protein [Candidatus Moeniiplasma glomeromycotorum]MCE8167487.1 hypothetical protein [Candidatus Moeniiplasma glomeromycotorum]
MRKDKNSLAKDTKNKVKKTAQKTKATAQQTKKKIDEARQTSTWKKTKQVAKKATRIAGSHLATLRTSITLSNEESELMNKLKDNLNKKNFYPSKSEILRAGLWNLRKMKTQELESAVKDLLKVKQMRVL